MKDLCLVYAKYTNKKFVITKDFIVPKKDVQIFIDMVLGSSFPGDLQIEPKPDLICTEIKISRK